MSEAGDAESSPAIKPPWTLWRGVRWTIGGAAFFASYGLAYVFAEFASWEPWFPRWLERPLKVVFSPLTALYGLCPPFRWLIDWISETLGNAFGFTW